MSSDSWGSTSSSYSESGEQSDDDNAQAQEQAQETNPLKQDQQEITNNEPQQEQQEKPPEKTQTLQAEKQEDKTKSQKDSDETSYSESYSYSSSYSKKSKDSDQEQSSHDSQKSDHVPPFSQSQNSDTTQTKSVKLPHFAPDDSFAQTTKPLATKINQNYPRRKSMGAPIDQSLNSTPGTNFLRSQTSTSKLKFLEERLMKTDDDDGLISEVFTSNRKRTMSTAALPNVQETGDGKIIEPFSYEPGPEYVISADNDQLKKEDEEVATFIQNHQELQDYEWFNSMIKNINEQENPFFSPYSDYLKARDEQNNNKNFQNSIPVKIFSEKVNRIEMENLNYPDREEAELSKSITFINDTDKPQSDQREGPSVYRSYSINQPPLHPRFLLNPVKEEQLNQDASPFLLLTLKDFDMMPKPLEPFFFTAYLYTAKKFISEEWNFAPECATQIAKDSSSPIEINLNKQGVFELPQDFASETNIKNTFLVIAVSHPITVEGNAPVNKYYLKGSGFETNAKLNIAKTFPKKNADILTVFAYTFANLYDLVKSSSTTEIFSGQVGQYTFQNFYQVNSPFSAQKIKDNIQESIKKKMREGDYKMKITLDVLLSRAIHPTVAYPDYDLIYLNELPPPAIYPNIRLSHKISLHIEQINLKPPRNIKARNIYCEITLRLDNDLDGLSYIHSHMDPPKLTNLEKTRCFYHEQKVAYDQVFIFDLPFPVPPKLLIHIDLYHLILKKSKEQKTWVGQVTIPIFESANKFITNGSHTYPVNYNRRGKSDAKTDSANSMTFSTLITSTLLASDANLFEFYSSKGSKTDSLKQVKKSQLIENFYVIVEFIIQNFKENPSNACQALNNLYNSLKETWKERTDDYFQIYAQVLSFRHPNAEYHNKILEGLAEFPDIPSGLYQFLFMLIIKSIYLTKDRSFGDSYTKFLRKVPYAIGQNPTREKAVEYAKFMNLLMDIGCYGASIEGANSMIYNLKTRHEITLFIYELFHPKFLYLSVMNSDKMISTLIELLRYSRSHNDQVFQALNFSIETLPQNIKRDIAQRLLDTLPAISPLQKMPFARFCPNGRVHSVIIYFAFILESMTDSEPIHEWFKNIENPSEFFDSLHFILDITEVKNDSSIYHREITYSIQAAILNAMTIMINVNEQMRELGFLTYHVLCSNMVADFLPILMSIPTVIAQKDISFLFKYYCPPLPKILVNLFKISKNEQNCLVNFINTLFDKDRERYGDTRRSLAVITRSIYQLNEDELQMTLDNLCQGLPPEQRPRQQQNKVIENPEVEEEEEESHNANNNTDDTNDATSFFNRGNLKFLCHLVADYLDTIKTMKNPTMDIETRSQLFWHLIEIFEYSPDVVIELLNKLSDMNLAADYLDEAVQAKLLIAAIVLEYLTLQNRIKPIFNEYHAAKAFESICSMTSFAMYKDDDCPNMIGYCDSPKFNLKSLISLLLNLTKMSFNNKSQMLIYEQAIGIIGIMWPILESKKSFYYTQRFFKIEHTVQMMLSKIPAEQDPLFGHYFRIAYYGDVFGKDDGKTYIYHEKMLTHLFELSNRLIDHYKQKFPNKSIELIKESGDVDRDNLDTKNNGYIQITFVEPYFPKAEQLLRTTSYNRSHMIKTFFFDTPFTQGSKAQGSIEHQWLRRTLLTVKNRMPSIFKIEEVIEIVNKNFEPIKVSYRQLRDRCQQIQAAISQNDFRNIQQLLHGSLLVMVNEGPSRMVEVFLSNSRRKLEGDQSKMEKYKDKLRYTFKLFLKVNEEALKLHGTYVAKNPMFIPLQNELEAGFASLSDKLTKYIDEEED
ncbi:hypothetical protein M9Y10_023388 [Tritrichomonas musculus]|uniref:DOCKER domain-containing protein n=1 Tax=Tritrichomonas musculus TaxID=1915356 RepID=A0ABR2KW13_9EUKA